MVFALLILYVSGYIIYLHYSENRKWYTFLEAIFWPIIPPLVLTLVAIVYAAAFIESLFWKS